MTAFWLFLFIAFLSGLAGAFQIPTLSLFLSTELSSGPSAIGLFYSVNAVTGIGISFWLAMLSDRLRVRRHLVFFCFLAAVANSVLFAINRDYLTLICLGSFLMALANSLTPQLFALAREHSRRPLFQSLMRAQLSLAWVAGPPIAFALVSSSGFMQLYLFTAVIFLIATLMLLFIPLKERLKVADSEEKAPVKLAVGLLFVTSVLMWSCSALYLIDIPLYVIKKLGFAQHKVGLMMGLAAVLEIPVMLLVGRYITRLGNKRTLIWALYAGMIFFTGLSMATTFRALMALQIFNALFIGILATSGMFFFQSLLRERPGLATTLFTNSVSVGIVIAGILRGSLLKDQHGSLYIVAVAFLILSRVILIRVHEEQEEGIN